MGHMCVVSYMGRVNTSEGWVCRTNLAGKYRRNCVSHGLSALGRSLTTAPTV